MTTLGENGKEQNIGVLFNDWVDVQDDRYRFLAIDDLGQIVVRIVVAEYFACEVAWGI